jgi:hypothetical protein
MHLDKYGVKHWYYRLKREYTAEAKLLKRMEERKARKEFRKMMKKYKIETTLAQEDNFDQFYGENKKNREPEGDDALPAGYRNREELGFYGTDVEFMRHHKRTKANMHESLSSLISSSSQTVAKGLFNMNKVSISYVDLNKACSLVVAYWAINNMHYDMLPDEEVQMEADGRREELDQLI